jgi:hypothetical protein
LEGNRGAYERPELLYRAHDGSELADLVQQCFECTETDEHFLVHEVIAWKPACRTHQVAEELAM